nr:MAG TPA: hypothetical protein [Bacteriophage sp.]DAO34030.1 MAG TPA: hypothetical protein [Bacteriophage sp.]
MQEILFMLVKLINILILQEYNFYLMMYLKTF